MCERVYVCVFWENRNWIYLEGVGGGGTGIHSHVTV